MAHVIASGGAEAATNHDRQSFSFVFMFLSPLLVRG